MNYPPVDTLRGKIEYDTESGKLRGTPNATVRNALQCGVYLFHRDENDAVVSEIVTARSDPERWIRNLGIELKSDALWATPVEEVST